MGTAAKCPSLGLLGKAKGKLLSAAFPGCGAVKLPEAQNVMEELPVPLKHKAGRKPRAPNRCLHPFQTLCGVYKAMKKVP